MKTLPKLLKEIDALYEQIEMGLMTSKQVTFKLREMRFKCLEKFDESSDEFQICVDSLIDCSNLIMN